MHAHVKCMKFTGEMAIVTTRQRHTKKKVLSEEVKLKWTYHSNCGRFVCYNNCHVKKFVIFILFIKHCGSNKSRLTPVKFYEY